MKTPTLDELLTPEIIQCVRTYLLAKTFAEVKREQVDKIERQLLSERCLTATLGCDSRPAGFVPHRITDPKDLYLCEEEAFKGFYAEASRRERAAGVKPADMPDEHCPALVAEHLQIQAENLLIEVSGKLFGVKPYQLHFEKRDQWLDLICRLVVNSPRLKRGIDS